MYMDKPGLIREMPAGKGFADIVFLPRMHKGKPALAIELKFNQTEQGAIKQINTIQFLIICDKQKHTRIFGIYDIFNLIK